MDKDKLRAEYANGVHEILDVKCPAAVFAGQAAGIKEVHDDLAAELS